jgi:Fic family protein
MESVVYEKRQDYYDALQAAQNANDSGVFIEFILSAVLEAVEAQAKIQADERKVNESSKRHDPNEPNDSNRESNELNEAIIKLIKEKGDITYAEVVERLRVSRATVQRHLQELKETGAIRRVGGTRGHWEVE